MQDASSSFETAVGTHRTWVPPRLRTDWHLNGYDGDGTFDDLSSQIGDEWSVDHSLDDGYPATVSFVSGTSVPEMDAELGGRVVGRVPMSAAAYWSPLRADSPIAGIERDVLPVTLDMGLITDAGPEYVRVFTGQMTSTPVKGGKARLKAISAARIKLMKQVLPPAFPASRAGGLNASWVVSWCLAQCGIYAGPKIRDGATVLYYPMHGSGFRFLDGDQPFGNQLHGDLVSVYEATPAVTFPGVSVDTAGWIDGPYVAAPDLQAKTNLTRRMYQVDPPFNYGQGQADAFSQSGNRGRLEMWVKGDSTDVNTVPGGSGSLSRLCGVQLFDNSGGGASAAMGVDKLRRVYVEVWDGTNRRTLTGGTLPSDGAWHFVGAAYDMTSDKLWTCLDNSSTSTAASMSTAALSAFDSLASSYWLSYLPFSDMTFSTGIQANPDVYTAWRNDPAFAPTAQVSLSQNFLVACAEKEPREAWEIISSYAQAELAMLRADELDVVQYLPLAWWVKNAQQQLQYSIDTSRNAASFDIDYDPSLIRNTVTVSYSVATLPTWSAELGLYRRVFELQNSTEIRLEPNSVTEITFPFSTAAVYVNVDFDVFTDRPAIAGYSVGQSYATFNTALDGSGTYVDGTGVVVEVLTWHAGQATVRFTNTTASALYLANDQNVPTFAIAGLTVTETQTYATDSDATSVAYRGERSLSVSAQAIQTTEMARRLARNLKMNLRSPVATVGDESSGVNVTADPRRQPGDLATLQDAETGASGSLWRVQGVRHNLRNAAYTQQLTVRETFPIAVVGQSLVGQSLVGPAQ